MKRREFMLAAGASVAGAGLGATTLAAPAIAQSAPEIRWRLTSGFPKSLDTSYGAAEAFAKYVSTATDGRFQVQVFAAGEIVGAFQALDALENGTVEMAHTASYFYVGKDPTFGLFTASPFGLNARQQSAWMYQGGGLELMNEFYGKYGLFTLPGGNTGTQMGGWFRREVNTVADLNGLKMRIAGLAGEIMSRFGLVPQQIAGGDLYSALERGTIDAAEYAGPYDDEKLGLNQVAPYYYYPGFWEGQAMQSFVFNKAKWESLPASYQQIVRNAAAFAYTDMLAKYDARNPAAIKRLVAGGAQLRPFSAEIMNAAYQATNEFYAEKSAENADFKKVIDALNAFRNEENLWFRIAEYTFDSFMVRLKT